MSDRDTIVALVAAVNATGTLPATAKLDCLDSDAPACSVQQTGGTRWLEQWIGGGGIGELPFWVLIRTDDADTAGRADAAGALFDLADALEAASLQDGWNAIRGVDTPTLVARDDSGTEVWRASYVLEHVRS